MGSTQVLDRGALCCIHTRGVSDIKKDERTGGEMTPEERWAELTVRINYEMFRLKRRYDPNDEGLLDNMLAVFHRVEQIMKELERI